MGPGHTPLGARRASFRPVQLLIEEVHTCSNLVLCGFQMHDTAGGNVLLCKMFLTKEYWKRGKTVS